MSKFGEQEAEVASAANELRFHLTTETSGKQVFALLHPRTDPESKQMVRSMNTRIRSLYLRYYPVPQRAATLDRDVLLGAEGEREADSRRYDTWTRYYYLLFGLGWIITVAGIFLVKEKRKP